MCKYKLYYYVDSRGIVDKDFEGTPEYFSRLAHGNVFSDWYLANRESVKRKMYYKLKKLGGRLFNKAKENYTFNLTDSGRLEIVRTELNIPFSLYFDTYELAYNAKESLSRTLLNEARVIDLFYEVNAK